MDIDLKKYLLVASLSLLTCDKDLGILTPRWTTACDSFHGPDVKFASVEWLLYYFSLNIGMQLQKGFHPISPKRLRNNSCMIFRCLIGPNPLTNSHYNRLHAGFFEGEHYDVEFAT